MLPETSIIRHFAPLEDPRDEHKRIMPRRTWLPYAISPSICSNQTVRSRLAWLPSAKWRGGITIISSRCCAPEEYAFALQEVEGFIRRGKANARTLTRAHILLKDTDGWTITRLSETFNGSPATVSNIRQRYREGGIRWEQWCLPKKIDVSFVAAMEDVLTVYEQPYDEAYPQVCLDEKLVTLRGDVVDLLPVKPC